MEGLFLHLRAQRSRTGTPSRLTFWSRVLLDTVSHALRERWGRPVASPRNSNGTRTLMYNLATDLRFAARTLVQSPLFTVVAVLTLALGMGANTAIFSVVNSVLLRSLPYPEPDAVVWVDEWQDSKSRSLPVAWPNFSDWREQSRSFTGLAAFNGWPTTVLGADRPLRVRAGGITEDFWKVFPVSPVAGRLTVPADHVEGGPGVVVLREDFWRTELSARPLDDVVLEIAGERLQAIGVVPSSLDFPFGAELWRPAFPSSTSRTAHNWRVVGRLAPGVTPAMADQELDAITQVVVADEPADPDFLAEGALVLPLKEQLAGSARRPLLLLLGAAGLVLLVACTNLASTLLARGETRHREMAIRASMGADRGRLLRQLLTESLVLAALGGAAGLALAAVLIRTLRSLGTVSLPRLTEVSIDPVALAFTTAVVLVTALVFGLLPAFRLSGVDVTPALKAGARGGSLGGGRGVWTALVGSEVALAFVLLVGSGLLVRSFATLLDVDSGVSIEGVVTAGGRAGCGARDLARRRRERGAAGRRSQRSPRPGRRPVEAHRRRLRAGERRVLRRRGPSADPGTSVRRSGRTRRCPRRGGQPGLRGPGVARRRPHRQAGERWRHGRLLGGATVRHGDRRRERRPLPLTGSRSGSGGLLPACPAPQPTAFRGEHGGSFRHR
jgi:predicted permease